MEAFFIIKNPKNIRLLFKKIIVFMSEFRQPIAITFWGSIPKLVSNRLITYRFKKKFLKSILFKEVNFKFDHRDSEIIFESIDQIDFDTLTWGIKVSGYASVLSKSKNDISLCCSTLVQREDILFFLNQLIKTDLIEGYEAVTAADAHKGAR